MKCLDSKNEETTVLGNQKSYFGGKVITSNKLIARTFTFLLIAIPYGLFSGTGMIWFIQSRGYTVPVIITIIFIASTSLFFYSCFSDPGIIPRQKSVQDTYDLFRGKKDDNKPTQEIHMMIDGRFLRIKYCTTCNMYRSPRSVHCRICDVCVKRFDHHCKWLGNCIGYNNYRPFISFIATTFLMIIAVITFSIIRAVNIKKDKSMVKGVVETVVTLSYIVLCGWFVAGLFVYHGYLIFTNQTTNEQLKSLFHEFNPWNRGILNNIKEILFSKRKIKHFYLNSLNIKKLYNPVSQVKDPQHLDLVKDHLVYIGDVLDHIPFTSQNQLSQNRLSSNSLDSLDSKSSIQNHSSKHHNNLTSVTNTNPNNQCNMYTNFGEPISMSSFDSSDLSISSLMDTYTKLKNNLNDTSYINQIALDKINNNIDNIVDHELLNQDSDEIDHIDVVHNGIDPNSKKRSKLVRKNGIDLSCRD